MQPPQVVNEFDPPDNPYGSGHRGVDLAGSVGQVVLAPSTGAVTFAGAIAGRGVVVVDHGAVRSTFEPVVAEVVVGATVGSGDQLGTLQAFGHHCDLPCLHWGVIKGDTYLDPLDFVGAGPSRLLPWWDDAAREGAFQASDPMTSRGGDSPGGRSTSPPNGWSVPSPGVPAPTDLANSDDRAPGRAPADTGMAAAAVIALAGGILAGGAALRVLRGRR